MIVFTITLIRHGETEYNRKRIIQGQMDTELADKGVYQAELCGQRLQHERFTHAYTSDLKRALVTGENILRYNTVTKCPLIKDVRLRERNFGEYEGRTCDDFMALLNKAKSTNKQMQDFTPPKGESLRDVRKRATDWFYDVCQQVRDMYENENLGNHMSGSRQSYQSTSNSQSLSSSQTSNCDVIDGNPTANSDTNNTDSEGHGSMSSGHGPEGSELTSSAQFGEEGGRILTPQSLSQSSLSCPLDENLNTEGESGDRHGMGSTPISTSQSELAPLPPSPPPTTPPPESSPASASSPTCPSPSSTSFKTTTNTFNNTSSNPNTTTTTTQTSSTTTTSPFFQPVFDSDIRLHIRSPQMLTSQISGCPNVSLSPIFEHRFSSISSSLSSGQNSSFDDTDHGSLSLSRQTYIPDILVISHGGFLKELVAFFCEELDAVLPGGLKCMAKTPFNTAVTKFSVNITEDDKIHTTCLMLNDRDHLLQAEVTVVKVDEI